MSVAVAQMPKALPERQAAVQRDTSNQLLEALLATCQKPATSPQLPGFGRELVPYFAAEKQPSVRSKGGSRSNSGSPQRTNRKATALAAAMVAAAKKTTKTPPAKHPMSASPTSTEEARAADFAALMSSWAGPGFCVSPTPEKLPKPSSALLG